MERFTFLDILRILSGILLINAVLSYWITSSTTWGYDGKYINPRYYWFQLGGQVNLTLAELSHYDGTDNRPIYVAINGSVYDVTSARHIYGPKGPYRFFSGKDAARAFVTGCFNKPDEFTYDLRGLDPEEARADVRKWQEFFGGNAKYWYVGVVQHEEITGDVPGECEHMKFPF
ncbi:hypothetical protein CLIB1444_14S00760 [[Candida] jaroonii]|uniref:Uncharacterized protein n=1 Tax=[Candida] jaroonii TaxID=467808 RepID=A0ACA9YDX4_9ASCO|nr:hypothetical protein CLIB1444_14S00760 [[Candida] jaroonii]